MHRMTTTDTTPTTEQPPVATIEITRIERAVAEVPIVGMSPLIVHRFDEKAKEMMLQAQQTKTRAKKAPKDPEADFLRSQHLLPDGSAGFPAVGFKAAIIGAARLFEGVKMTELRPALFVAGEGPDQLVPIISDPPRMREDTVRLNGSTADLRYRAEYTEWSATLTVRYIPSLLSLESVLALVDAAGLGGIGEWRPSKSGGPYGTFQVV